MGLPDFPAAPPAQISRPAACLLLALLAVALCMPAFLAPPMTYASFWIDIVWTDQFAGELARGTLYPRWLPHAHDGLGAPTFYFYAPLAFYLASALKLAGLSAYGAVVGAFLLAWFGSGVAMLHWLGWGRWRSLAGAALYMAAPYHVIDVYRRGALAEFCCYILVPLLLSAVRRAAAGRGFVPLAFAYAALLMTHLPVALLTSVLLILPYGARCVWRDPACARALMTGLLLGLGLAAIYLVPALSLQRWIAADKLWSVAELLPRNWSFVAPERWPDRASVILFIVLTATLALAAVPAALRRERWAWWALGCCAVVAGLVPGFWSIPLMTKVQFPWRALLLVELAVATAVARSTVPALILTAALVPSLALSLTFARPTGAGNLRVGELLERHPDVLEYLPPGASREHGGTFSQWALDLSKRTEVLPGHDEGARKRPFYFPAWQVRCDGRRVMTMPDPATHLLRFEGTGCSWSLGRLWAEIAGAGLSLLALLACALAGARRRISVHAVWSGEKASSVVRACP